MASPTQWIWVWVNSGSWWWTGRPGVLWFMGSQSQTRLNDWTEHVIKACMSFLNFNMYVEVETEVRRLGNHRCRRNGLLEKYLKIMPYEISGCVHDAHSWPILCNPTDHRPSGSLSMEFPGRHSGVGCHHFILQGIFLTQSSNLCSCASCIGRWILYH